MLSESSFSVHYFRFASAIAWHPGPLIATVRAHDKYQAQSKHTDESLKSKASRFNPRFVHNILRWMDSCPSTKSRDWYRDMLTSFLFTFRSQIQIATRVFDFVLPPPPAPEDSPSVSSRDSSNRHFSPTLDAISSSPNSSVHSPPPAKDIELPDVNEIDKSSLIENKKPLIPTKPSNKKRKKCGDSRPPPPEVMPERPQLTYAQLCYRAIKSMDGKATLQEICAWISDNYDWYRYNEGNTWEVSLLWCLVYVCFAVCLPRVAELRAT